MINVQRRPEAPASLATPRIRQYIDDVKAHLDNPGQVARPDPAGTYRNSDLLEALDECFYGKCYLTEEWFPDAWCMDVEHFVPQQERPELRYAWTNLYPAAHRANNMKPRTTPQGGYLDPCSPHDDVEREILYSIGINGDGPHFAPKDEANIKAVNTCLLLNRVHNGHNYETNKATAGLRHDIQKKHIEILNAIIAWKHEPDGSVLKNQYERRLSLLLSRKKAYTMLMRSIMSVMIAVPENLLD